MEKIYKHLGYYSDLNDIQRLYDKCDIDVIEEMLGNNGCFHECDNEEKTETILDMCDATYVRVNDKDYAVIRDLDWDISVLSDLDADSDEDNNAYDRTPSYIDIYELVEIDKNTITPKKEFVDFKQQISKIHQNIILEIVDCFKRNEVSKICIEDEENPLILPMSSDWGEIIDNEIITHVEVETHENNMVIIRLFKDEDTYYELNDCVDNNAVVLVYEWVWGYFYGQN